MRNLMMLTDGYKVDHRRQYPPGTTRVYSNFTPRSTRIGGADSVIFFGLQYFLREYLSARAYDTFFARNRGTVVAEYRQFLEGYLGPVNAAEVGTEHIGALHELGYVPLRFCALNEGTAVPFRVPMFTVENTHDDFAWVTNYFETLISSMLWLPCTSATTAKRYRRLLVNAAELTGGDVGFVDWQGHDFSFRGMGCLEAAALSGAGHLLSFTGTDSIPAIELLEQHYAGFGLIGGSVPATEHSVMCAGGPGMDEFNTFIRLMDLYPKGIVSVVSDTWDLWNVIGDFLPSLKERILARDGKLVIRPDSGDPVLILTGDAKEEPGSLPHKGVIEALWDIFGGRLNSAGYKELDPHIGAIYGDSITEERARLICERLKAKGFASTNVVFGIGSYTYQYVTRDTNGFALKATWAEVEGTERFLFKDPKTDNGLKKSARGRLAVLEKDGGLKLLDGLTLREHRLYDGPTHDCDRLKPVWEDGRFVHRPHTLDEIRARVAETP